MTLSLKQLSDVCLLNSTDKSKSCRYLVNDELDENKWHCQKLRPNIKSKIDHDLFIAKHKKEVVASGDNCAGYPLLRHITQGYDLD